MTGLDRLRELADDMAVQGLWGAILDGKEERWNVRYGDGMTVNGMLRAIADQIEAEQEERIFARCRQLLPPRASLVEVENEGGHKFRQTPDEFTHKRPVLDADGVPIRVGDTVWDTNGDELVIGALEDGGNTVTCRHVDVGDGILTHGMWSPSDLTHRHPVLDADGVPIKVGDTVYLLPGEWCGEYPLYFYRAGDEMVVKELCPDHEVEGVLRCAGDGNCDCFPLPCQLTHTKPEPDTWERIEEDKDLNPFDYFKKVGHKLWTFDNAEGCDGQ